MLEAKNIMLFYENAIAVNNLSFTANTGKITGIFGSNSAGKTSLMWVLSGIILDMRRKEAMRGGERITVLGEVLYEGENIIAMKPSERAKRGIILCPERRRVFSESSVLENLRIGGYLATREQARRTMAYVFELFPRLQEVRKRSAGFLSGGEQQMLAIGRALMAQPKVLLLDEPLLGLSPALEQRLVQAIKAINAETGITIIVAEQYARPLFPIIDYGYIIENGASAMEGTGGELMSNPDVREAYFGV